MLQCGDFRSLLEKGANSASGGMGRGKRRDARYVVTDRRAPNRFFVVERFAAQGRVDHQIDLTRFHHDHNVPPGFVHLEYRFGLDAGRFQRHRSSSSRKQAKTQRRQLFSKSSQMLFVTVVYAEENRTLARQALPRRKLGLRESLSVRCRNPHYFASFFPVINRAATFASGTPVALLTNGTVRDARGFTSSTYTVSR